MADFFKTAAESHQGLTREANEDRVYVNTERGIFAVIDGVGGDRGGEIAALIARDCLRARLERRDAQASQRIREALRSAHQEILRLSLSCPGLSAMACVATVAVIEEGVLTLGHVGDTRAYLLKTAGAPLHQLTRDHGLDHTSGAGKQSSVVTKFLGGAPRDIETEIQIVECAWGLGHYLLLCTDGLSDQLEPEEMGAALTQGTLAQCCETLLGLGMQRGGTDNISLVLVQSANVPRSGIGVRPWILRLFWTTTGLGLGWWACYHWMLFHLSR